MKIGILVTDRVRSELVQEHGEYSDMFGRLLARADPEAEFENYDVERGPLPGSAAGRSDDCDGYLVTGSRYSVYDDLDWIVRLEGFLRRLIEDHRPLFAVCFGHQLVAQALGGSVEKAGRGWTLGLQTTSIASPFPWADSATSRLNLIHSHQDQVVGLPEGAVLVGSNDACPISMYRIGGHVMSCQGHPEFSPDYARQLYDARRELFGEELWHEARESLDGRSDEKLVARWAMDFFSAGGRPR